MTKHLDAMRPLFFGAALPLALMALPLQTIAAPAPSETVAAAAQQQKITIKGTVTDKTGEPLIGVSVYAPATKAGTVTDIDGNYSLQLPSGDTELVFSYIGYTAQTVKPGARTELNITLQEENTTLKEVVVTAMGIRRKEESLTYSTQQVKAEDLMRVQDPNLVNSLDGKVSGITITPSAGGAGGNTKIVLRGNKSILGSSTPLIVIDGVPMQNGARSTIGDAQSIGYSSVGEGSDPLSMINPDDIESINVLKGSNAAALYGSVAANGALMITTKKGRDGKMAVNFSSNVTFDTPFLKPEIQNEYGAAYDALAGTLSPYSWGSKIGDSPTKVTAAVEKKWAESPDTNIGPNGTPVRDIYLRNYAKDDLADFFRTGVTTNNSIALSGGTDKMKSYFSYGNSHANGMVEKNSYNRHTFAFRQHFEFFDRVKIDISANYIQTITRNRPGGGTVLNPMYHMYMMPRNVDIDYYRTHYAIEKGAWHTTKDQIIYERNYKTGGFQQVKTNPLLSDVAQDWAFRSPLQNNPYWLLNMNTGRNDEDRFFGNVTGTLDIIDGLSVQARVGIDHTKYTSESNRYATTYGPADMYDFGTYSYSNAKTQDLYTDFMLTYNKTFGDWDINAAGGYVGHIVKTTTTSTYLANATVVDASLLRPSTVVNYFETNGGSTGVTSTGHSSDWNKGALFTAQVGWKDAVFIDGSYRHDWYRAFRQFSHRGTPESYGYIGVGGNAIVSNLVKMPEAINYLKYRISYSTTANSIPNQVYSQSTKNVILGTATVSNFAKFEDPRPEKTYSFETGIELLMLRNCLSFDLTYYNAKTENLYMVYSNASGKAIPDNSASIRNQGVEATISYDLKFCRDWRWKTSFNVSFNDNEIVTLGYQKDDKGNYLTGTDGNLVPVTKGDDFAGARVYYAAGGSIGDMYVTDFMKDANGNWILNSNGAPQLETAAEKKYTQYVGNMNSKWMLGWSNTFNYKDFSLFFQINGRIGGKVISLTEAYLDNAGLSQRSADARAYAEANNLVASDYGGGAGMYCPDGSGRIIPVQAYYQAIGGKQFTSQYVYSGTNFRLRELSLGYTFRDLLGQNKNLKLSFVARNLFFLYKDCPTDPDVALSTGNGLGAYEMFNMPSARSYGFSLNVNF